MIPEGLQYSSIADIVAKVKSLKMNSVRMGWTTEMVDDILDNGGDITLRDTMAHVLSDEHGETIVAQILQHNPTVYREHNAPPALGCRGRRTSQGKNTHDYQQPSIQGDLVLQS
ncbi:hypothetical protein EDB81DRAFT_886980 [Dactylonectria macrodidyma]|uniref:Uncharacterized protein n=1 Tax=Dactylonectria macrodidyma TaxID=307937 RepID=A0A9P9E973_9HYPO|nr:hypothetical protein EDB81DRAFT_886980 [Dactylonectria macrodidyma]